MKHVCNTCNSLGDFHFPLINNQAGVHYPVCSHKDIIELFPQGRVIEGPVTKSPIWCPQRKQDELLQKTALWGSP